MTSSPTGPLHTLSLLDTVAAFRSREVSPVEFLDAHIERIERLDPRTNAISEKLYDTARDSAREAERAYAQAADPSALPPLLGVPLLVKAQQEMAGYENSRGSLTREGIMGTKDNPSVARLKSAGAVPFARTTNPEFSCATFTQTRMWGVTRNPWNLDRTPGGSSGGSGAAVAAGYSPLATATDIAGSTRIPAAFCGLVGFKTPFGRVPGAGVTVGDWYRGEHVLTRTVADAAYGTNVLAGQDYFDSMSLKSEPPLPTSWAGAAGMSGQRIAYSRDLGCYEVDADVEANFLHVVDALRAAGAEVVEVEVGLDAQEIDEVSGAHYGHILAPSMVDMAGGPDRVKDMEDYAQLFHAHTTGKARRFPLYDTLQMENHVQQQLAHAMDGFDVLLTPTSAVGSLEADNAYLDGIERPSGHLDFYWQAHMTIPFNIANRNPVLAVPSGLGDTGVPTSVQVVGHPYQDRSVFAVGAAIEELLPFAPSPFMAD
ncbi:amidase [Brevibacterium litoralis]|uniref:amidase n=1 Tax=Brevibacterium litoralis TaxID=3138935 RepID=UPI0032EC65C1